VLARRFTVGGPIELKRKPQGRTELYIKAREGQTKRIDSEKFKKELVRL